MVTRELIPGMKRGFDAVLYKLWPLLMPVSLADVSQSKQMWQVLLLVLSKCQSGFSQTVGHA